MTVYNISINQSWYFDVDIYDTMEGDIICCQNDGGWHVGIIAYFDWVSGDAVIIYGGGSGGKVKYDDDVNVYEDELWGNNTTIKGYFQ